MNTTMEKSEMMENEMEMGMEAQMPEMMKANLVGETDEPKTSMNPIEVIMGIVKNQINDLEESCNEADIAFANAHHDNKYGENTYKLEDQCKMLHAQKSILIKVLDSMEDVMSSMMPECA